MTLILMSQLTVNQPVSRSLIAACLLGDKITTNTNMEKVHRKMTTQRQYGEMLDFMEANPTVANGRINSNLQAKTNLEHSWSKLAKNLNAIGPPQRDGKQWRRVWKDYKHSIKSKLRLNEMNEVGTGGGDGDGRYTICHFNPIENRVIKLMGFDTNATEVVDGSRQSIRPEFTKQNILEIESNDFTIETLDDGDFIMDDDVIQIPNTRRKSATSVENGPKRKMRLKMKLLEKQVNEQQDFYDNFNKKMDKIIFQNKDNSRYWRKLYELQKERLKKEDEQRLIKNKYLLSILKLKKKKHKTTHRREQSKPTASKTEDTSVTIEDRDLNNANTLNSDENNTIYIEEEHLIENNDQCNLTEENADEFNIDDDLESTTSASSESMSIIVDNDIDDEHTVFGKLVATQMRTLSPQSLFQCQINILEIIAKEKMKNEVIDSLGSKNKANKDAATSATSADSNNYHKKSSFNQKTNAPLEEMLDEMKKELLDSDYE